MTCTHTHTRARASRRLEAHRSPPRRPSPRPVPFNARLSRPRRCAPHGRAYDGWPCGRRTPQPASVCLCRCRGDVRRLAVKQRRVSPRAPQCALRRPKMHVREGHGMGRATAPESGHAGDGHGRKAAMPATDDAHLAGSHRPPDPPACAGACRTKAWPPVSRRLYSVRRRLVLRAAWDHAYLSWSWRRLALRAACTARRVWLACAARLGHRWRAACTARRVSCLCAACTVLLDASGACKAQATAPGAAELRRRDRETGSGAGTGNKARCTGDKGTLAAAAAQQGQGQERGRWSWTAAGRGAG